MATELALARLLQLASPALPVGGYSYSEGLEALAAAGELRDAAGLHAWLRDALAWGPARVEAALVLRAWRAARAADGAALARWNDWTLASRETAELRAQGEQMGASLLALARALPGWRAEIEPAWDGPVHFVIAFGLVAAAWELDEAATVLGYLQAWAANLVNAGVRIVPLGQTAGQQVLARLGDDLVAAARAARTLGDDELDACGWGLALASMAHETQYSRLFRS